MTNQTKNNADNMDKADLVDKPEGHPERTHGAAITATSYYGSPEEARLNFRGRDPCLLPTTVTTGSSSQGPKDASSNPAGRGARRTMRMRVRR